MCMVCTRWVCTHAYTQRVHTIHIPPTRCNEYGVFENEHAGCRNTRGLGSVLCIILYYIVLSVLYCIMYYWGPSPLTLPPQANTNPARTLPVHVRAPRHTASCQGRGRHARQSMAIVRLSVLEGAWRWCGMMCLPSSFVGMVKRALRVTHWRWSCWLTPAALAPHAVVNTFAVVLIDKSLFF